MAFSARRNFITRNYNVTATLKHDDVFITKIDNIKSDQSRSESRTNRPKKLAVKDNIASANGTTTTCASKILINYKSPIEAKVLTKLHKNGEFELIGKSKMDEFGMGSNSNNSCWGPVRRKSPLLRNFSVGGSSGGSAVAVADGYCQLGVGTDTGGSIRLPAAYTGIVGFKPSYGLISRHGVIPYANSLDTIGFLTHSVLEAENAFKQTMGHDPYDPTSLTDRQRERVFSKTNKITNLSKSVGIDESESFANRLRKITLGFPLEYNITEIDPEILRVWKLILKIFRANGAKVIPISLPTTKHALRAYYILAPAEAASNLAKYDGVRYGSSAKDKIKSEKFLYSTTRGSLLGSEVRRRILLGSYMLSSTKRDNYFIQAQKVRRLVQRDFDMIFNTQNPLRDFEQFDMSRLHQDICVPSKLGPKTVDFIVCPTAPTYPPQLMEVYKANSIETYMNDVFTVPASLAGLPSLNIPVKLLDDNLFAAGIQLIGQYGTDFHLLALGRELEKLVNHCKNYFRPLK